MPKRIQKERNTNIRRISSKVFWWGLIAFYTFILPEARVVYDTIVDLFGQDFAGKIPLVLVIIVGCGYATAVWRSQQNLKNLIFLIPCAVISYLIMIWVENPNKHIHIPEYVLMAWLLFFVLSKDYQSKDIFVLIFVLTSILGVVDELEQGLHPSRFYGWIDMVVNSASGLIGVFTIMGLKTMKPFDWSWAGRLKEHGSMLFVNLFGFTSTAVMCVFLFRVQAREAFWGVYPVWLWVWNVLFWAISLLVLAASLRKFAGNIQKVKEKNANCLSTETRIVNLWIMPMLVILFYIHSLLVYLSISGVGFA